MNTNVLNGMSLAYMGDAIYEIYIRKHFIENGNYNVNKLHKLVTNYTCGKAQAFYVHEMLNNNILKEDEINAFKHGRNSHISSRRKNIDIQTYLEATGFEAIFGYLYFNNDIKRIEELIDFVFSVGEIKNGEIK